MPKAKLYVDDKQHAPVKLAQFVEGQTLKSYLAKASAEEAALVIGKIQGGFVADALFANYDVIGLGLDNILIDPSGQVWRIDNGGSFRFRAQGAAKAGWGAKVTELETMRDAKLNPSAARVFGSISDADIKRQIGELMQKREAILAAAPHGVREVLAKRFEDLAQRIAAPTDSFAQEVAASRIVGKVTKRDRGDIEDTQILFWQEHGKSRSLVTRAKLKLTEAGSEKVMERLRASLPAAMPSAAAPPDAYWDTILNAIKTVNQHAGDGAYNVAKLDALTKTKSAIEKLKDQAALKKHYLDVIAEIEKAKDAKVKTPLLKAFEPKAEAAPAVTQREFNIERKQVEYNAKVTERGRAREQAGSIYNHDAYVIDLDGTKVKFVPFKEPTGVDFAAPYALRGYVEVVHPAEAGEQAITATLEHLAKIGIDTAPVTEHYDELVYLRKGMQVRTDVFTPAKLKKADELLAADGKSDPEKITALKAMVKKEMGLDLPDRITPDYDPRGKGNAFNQGWVRTERWDLPRAQVEKEMADYKLHHSSSAAMPELIESILNGGGDFTCTTERLRKGISISQGMSPVQDLNTGGANYLFTRIRRASTADSQVGLNLKIGNLARQDAFSFSGDRYGNVKDSSAYKVRAKTVDELKAYANGGSNETILKWGVPFLDEVDSIVCKTAAEKKSVLAVFSRHGYSELPDGRKISDIVKIK